MVGRSIKKELENKQKYEIIVADKTELNLLDQASVKNFFKKEKPTKVIIAAAKVGGIYANNHFPAEFIYNNIMIAANVINAAYEADVESLIQLGSSCIYPKNAAQPIRENQLMTGSLEGTNEPYAIAKIAAIKLCESYNRQYGTDYRSLMPTNLYGPNDNFNLQNSHVMPALIQKLHLAKQQRLETVEIWGTGKPRREFLYVDDLAEATLHILEIDAKRYWKEIPIRQSHINVGTGYDISILELAKLLSEIIGYEGTLTHDLSKPDGTFQKRLDTTLMDQIGWNAKTNLKDGIGKTYDWFLSNQGEFRN